MGMLLHRRESPQEVKDTVETIIVKSEEAGGAQNERKRKTKSAPRNGWNSK